MSEIDDLEESNIIDLDITIDNLDNMAIGTLTTIDLSQSNDLLPLIHPELIDWELAEPINVPIFANDDAIINFLCCDKPDMSSTHKSHNNTLSQEGVKSSSCKIENRNNGSNDENHLMAVLDLEKVKIKLLSDSENLSKAPKYGRFDSLPKHYHERSSVLVEPTYSINLCMIEKEKTLHLATSMTEQEKPEFIKFFEDRHIKFFWSYSDIPGLDLDLLMHHLSKLPSGIKLLKQKTKENASTYHLVGKGRAKKFVRCQIHQIYWLRRVDFKYCTYF